ncbi:MAG: arsenate reductase (glutaredoxin) [Bacteroidota bacterium]
MKIYHNPRCRKSRETLALIRAAGVEPEIIEYLKTPPNGAEIAHLLRMLGIPAEKLVRKGESIYKEQYKGKNLPEEDWIAALVAHPKLIERPVVVQGERAVIGRPPENVRRLLD